MAAATNQAENKWLSRGNDFLQLINPEGGNVLGWIDSTGTPRGNLASGGGGTPGGSDKQIQFNDGGVFGGDAKFFWDKTTKQVTAGIQEDNAAFDTNIQDWWGQLGNVNIGAVSSDGQRHIGQIIQMQGDGKTQGLAIMALSTATDPNLMQAFALNIDAAANSAVDAPDGAIFGIDASVSNFGTGLVGEMAEYFATGSLGTGPVTNSSALHAFNHGQAGTVNARGIWIEDQTGATKNWAIQTGLGKVDFGDFFTTHANAAPADASLSAGEISFWFDKTNGASKLMLKAKQADGTVKTAAVALS